MSLVEIIILAFGLSMDSFAISIANGISFPQIKFSKALFIAAVMGAFHILMPVTGYYLSHAFWDEVQQLDHWIAFGLLGFIGGKMIFESVSKDHENAVLSLNTQQIFLQSLATSIDALAIGISLGLLHINIFSASAIIGSVTFFMVMIGLKAGIAIGSKLGKKMEFLGGGILILIGVKILIEHMLFH